MDEYIVRAPKDVQDKLKEIRVAIRECVLLAICEKNKKREMGLRAGEFTPGGQFPADPPLPK